MTSASSKLPMKLKHAECTAFNCRRPSSNDEPQNHVFIYFHTRYTNKIQNTAQIDTTLCRMCCKTICTIFCPFLILFPFYCVPSYFWENLPELSWFGDNVLDAGGHAPPWAWVMYVPTKIRREKMYFFRLVLSWAGFVSYFLPQSSLSRLTHVSTHTGAKIKVAKSY